MLRHHIKVENQTVVPYTAPQIGPRYQISTKPGTGDPKTTKLQPLTVCVAGEGAELGSLWLGFQEREEQQIPRGISIAGNLEP